MLWLTQSLPREEEKKIENVFKICKLLAVNAATSATAEKTFFDCQADKNMDTLRSTILPCRFNSIAVLETFIKPEQTTLITVAKLLRL